ncbi:hypothetical protein GOBAR_AA19197 [Gossypium barbadense]|uniref:Uncharacterized protein n=1 Tax=Gossypium barbadense TaxID=3634 RepID=A0A2P5XDQ7_GOSBA|nr:hypothetical protein GOBAR_AA19197 [Gossypium barbadense]
MYHPQVPGEPTQTTTSLVETATGAIQSFRPIKQIHQHLCAFHFFGYDMTRQVEAHHFCAHQNEEMRQWPIERQDLDKVCKTYGKTIHFWQVDKGDNLPLGLPQLMMTLTRDGQLYDELARDVEKRFGVSFEKERAKRADMEGPTHGIHPLANGGGKGLITKLRELHCNRTDPSFASSQL